jgi:5'-3' exoribonuclease 1
VKLNEVDVSFELSQPFLPYAQLLSVLPPLSSALLPEPLAQLMLSPTSPLLKYYPENFEIDMDGKRQEWEGVALLPFIDETELLTHYRAIDTNRYTPAERVRNGFGSELAYVFSPAHSHRLESPGAPFQPIENCMVLETKVNFSFAVGEEPHPFLPVLHPETKTGVHSPAGFPTLSSLPWNAEMKSVAVNIFGQPSKKDSMILRLVPSNETTIPAVSSVCLTNFPFLTEAMVVRCISVPESNDKSDNSEMSMDQRKLKKDYGLLISNVLTRKGLDVSDMPGSLRCILEVRLLESMRRDDDGSLHKVYSSKVCIAPALFRFHAFCPLKIYP